MADRSQNITINYKFNTAEIEKANAILNLANTATNQLQEAGQKAGQQVASGFQKATPAIEQMRIQLARLKTQIEVSSDPKRVAELSNQYKVLKTQLDAATKSAFNNSKAMKDTAQSTQSLAGQFGNLYQAAKLLVTAGIVREVVDIGLQMATLKGNVEGVERAFARAFPNQVKILSDLRAATKGTVTDFELMQRTLQATNLGVAVESLPVLFEFAAARAQQTGESVDYLVDSIVRGIGRKSTLVLDNLGLSAVRLKEQFNGAALASLSVGEVTKGVAEIARVELEKMGGYAETSATQVSQLKTSWEELRVELAKKIESGGIISFLDDSIKGLRELIQGNKEVMLIEAQRIASVDAARVMESRAFKELDGNQQGRLDFVQQEINSRVQLIGRYNDYISKVREEREIIRDKNPYDSRLDSMLQTIRGYNDTKVVIAATILALKEYMKELEKTKDVETGEITTIETLNTKLKELKEQRQGYLDDQGKMQGTSITNTPELDRLQREIILLEDRILKISDNISWQKQWDQSRITSALATEQETENLKRFNDELDKLTEKMAGNISFSTGDLLNPNRDAKEVIDIDAIEESLKEVANLIGRTGVSLFDDQEVADPIANSFWTRFRLAFKNGAEDTSNELQGMINDAMDELKLGSVDIIADQLNATREIELQSMKLRLNDLKKFFDEQIELAGNNEQAKRALRKREEKETAELNRKIFEKEKQTRRSQAIIDGAAGVVKAFATYPWPVALIISGLLTAKTLSQLNIINKQKPGFAKGVIGLKGKGSETSDSIPVNLSRGESVMTAWETRHAGDVLKDIRAKKLDNKVLKNLKQGREPVVSQQQFNDEKIIKAIEKNRPPDVLMQSGIVYESRLKGDAYRNKVRAKSVRL